MSEQAPPPPPVDLPRASPRRRRIIFVGLAILLPVVVLVVAAGLLVQGLGWKPFSQASGSMRPTLSLNEWFFVDTHAYREARRPDYGDIVAVAVPARLVGFSASGGDVTLVKRVLGLPGDHLGVVAGILSVNGRPLPQEPLGEMAGRPGRKTMRLREQTANGTTYEIMRNGDPFVVPQGHYFVMGDNRDDSLDSRFWAKQGGWYLPAGNITGRAAYIYWAGFDRLDRIGTALK